MTNYYEVTRLAFADITAYALLNTASYVIADWTRQSDMDASIEWGATMPEFGMRANYSGSVELGSGRIVSPYSGVIEFFTLTPLMQQYINTQMSDKPVAIVTALVYDDLTRTQTAFTGELVVPYLANAEGTYSPFGSAVFSNNQYVLRGATKKTVSVWGQVDGTSIWSWPSGALISKSSQ